MSDFAEIKINMSDRKGVMCYVVLSKKPMFFVTGEE